MEQPHEIRFKGLGVSEGIVIGQVVRRVKGMAGEYAQRLAAAEKTA